MKKTSTPKSIIDYKETENYSSPKKTTEEFLKVFARCYSYQPKLSLKLGSLIIN